MRSFLILSILSLLAVTTSNLHAEVSNLSPSNDKFTAREIQQYQTGLAYYHGKGVARDHQEAAKWFRLAAEDGYAKAQSNLGDLYRMGDGVLQDYKEAAKWYRLAAV